MRARRARAGVACMMIAAATASNSIAVTVQVRPAVAAFEIRGATPAALGAASMDLPPEPLFDREPAPWRLSASHASLFSVEGLTVEEAAADVGLRPIQVEVAYAQVGLPGTREKAASLRLSESDDDDRPIALRFSVERLSFSVDGEAALGGWAGGGGVASRIPIHGAVLEVSVAGERLVTSSALRALAVRPSLPFSIRLRAGGASAAWVDRWESDGRRSPRLILTLPLGDICRVRLAHGDSPGRTGAALAVRWRLVEISVGRQDDSAGGTVSSFALALRPAPTTRIPAGRPNP